MINTDLIEINTSNISDATSGVRDLAGQADLASCAVDAVAEEVLRADTD